MLNLVTVACPQRAGIAFQYAVMPYGNDFAPNAKYP